MTVRTLTGSGTDREISVPVSLVAVQGAILTVRSDGYSAIQPVGTLVEIITPDRYYLGEIASLQGETATILTEHELQRSAIEAIQATWGTELPDTSIPASRGTPRDSGL